MENEKVNNMVSAYIDQILMWIVIFIGFAGLLFFVIDYSNIMRIKGNIDLMTEYAARMVATNKDEVEIAAKLNDIKSPYFADIAAVDINCDPPIADDSYQIIFNITGLYTDTKVMNPQNNIPGRRVVFNDNGTSNKIECSLILNKK